MNVAPAERPYRVAVVGAGEATAVEEGRAEALGAALARQGAVLVCGGRGGVMAAAARGATGEGGLTVGILPDADVVSANPWIALPLATGLGQARNALVVGVSEAVIAVGGSWGTLSEVALARKLGIPVALLEAGPSQGPDLPILESPEAAADWALTRAREGRSARSG